MNKEFNLVKCENGKNTTIADCSGVTKEEAVKHFQTIFRRLNLDNDGYAKVGDITYTVGETYAPNLEAGA